MVKYGGKTLPDQGRQVSTDPGREAFYGSGYGPGRLFSGTRCGLSAQQPRMPTTVRSPLDKVVTEIQPEHCVNAPTLIEVPNFFRILLNFFQNRVAGPGFLLRVLVSLSPQREVYTVRPALQLAGADVLLESRKPHRTGHAPQRTHPSDKWHTLQIVPSESTR